MLPKDSYAAKTAWEGVRTASSWSGETTEFKLSLEPITTATSLLEVL